MSQTRWEVRREFEAICNRLCDETATSGDRERLGRLLWEVELRDSYIAAMTVHAHLAWREMPCQPLSPETLEHLSKVDSMADSALAGIHIHVGGSHGMCSKAPASHPASGPPRSPSSARHRFQGSIGSGNWWYASRYATLTASLAVLLLIGASVAAVVKSRSRQPGTATELAKAPSTAHQEDLHPGATELGSASVARLVRTYDCVWPDAATPLNAGDRLVPRQKIELRSGMVEIVFDCDAHVLLQGPAIFLPESARCASLSSGKVTVKAEGAAAKGFAIRTPAMKTIDLGTEFGLEVAPTGIEQVHVFRGEVEVAASAEKGVSTPSKQLPPQRLLEKQGIEVNPSTGGVKLVANNGERFARSLDEAENRRHVVAWWRFEDHPVGVLVQDSQEGKAPVRGSLDSSVNGNDLYTWGKGTEPTFSADVPAATIPLTGEPNFASLDNSRPPASHPTRDLFTRSEWSRPSPVDVQSITPAKWTVEASVKPAKLRADNQTFVVRDGMDLCAADPNLAPFAMYVTADKQFEVAFCDVDGRKHTATCPAVPVEENRWYHVVATSDGSELKLYVDSLDGDGFVCTVAELPKSGSTALARSFFAANGPRDARHRHIWSVGRGCYAGEVCRWFQGWIDEVRICDVALEPKDFLFTNR